MDIIFRIEQIILKKAFEHWVANDIRHTKVKSLYLYPRAGHTTLWKILRKERTDLLLIAETLDLGRHQEFVDNFSPGGEVSSYRYKVKNKIIIIDSGGWAPDRYERFIDYALKYGAKGVLVS